MVISRCTSSTKPSSCSIRIRTVSCNTHHCPVNGGWSSYGSWINSGTCSKTCGGGSQRQIQSRTCTQPAPAYGGAQCGGNGTQQKSVPCNTNPCPVNGGWTSFGSWRNSGTCSKTCGGGSQQQVQTRTCTQPAPAYGGAQCSGGSSQQKSVECNTDPCPVNGGWTSYGPWVNSGPCSKTCGGGSQQQVQTRTCTQPVPAYGGAQCNGSSSQQRHVECNTDPCPVNGGWTSYGSWSNSGPCSKTCGGGSQQQIRTRTCTQPAPAYGGAECTGSDSQQRPVDCNVHECPAQRQIQSRTCTQPAPAYGGAQCGGNGTQQKSVPCNTNPCPVNGGWTSFGSWRNSGTCSKTCGGGSQQQVQTRTCTQPAPAYGGAQCSGGSSQQKSVELNGGWTSYGPWVNSGPCSKTCGGGSQQQVQTRTCTQPVPAYGGAQCNGSSSQQRHVECNTDPCPVNGGWTSYGSWSNSGPCSKTCGGGSQQQIRTRTCTQPAPAYGGAECTGSDSQQRPVDCNVHECPVNGGWSDFGDWGDITDCSTTCGGGEGIKTRHRTCTNPAPLYGGTECEGDTSEEKSVDCAPVPCPINGGWSEYSKWLYTNDCSVSCGTGTRSQLRTRTCTNPTPQFGGEECEGNYNETLEEECTFDPCPVDGGWNDWGNWTVNGKCSTTCGTGEQIYTRIRKCNNPEPAFGGLRCEGKSLQQKSEICGTDPCPIDGNWNEWQDWAPLGKCSKSCGAGFIKETRTRVCDNPEPQYGGEDCWGDSTERRQVECFNTPCPVNGDWSVWTDWEIDGLCSVTCGKGEIPEKRTRTCTNPRPMYNGEECQGDSIQRRTGSCNESSCPVNGDWSVWTDWETDGLCSVTCGNGEIPEKRTRTCTNPRPMYNGEECQGDSKQRRTGSCNKSSCPGLCDVDGYTFASEQDFTKYFVCQGGRAVLSDCAYKQRWNEETRNCVQICPSFFSSTFAHPNDCRRYVQCMWGFSIILMCPSGTAFDVATNRCIHEAQVTTCN
ncbi:SCO-spondin [Patella vulgata]|uniref:SCO-spondin n=1 Tax=Patella vulgata TaxID=6465 RepID=UPI0024A88FAB|nr:SCO-spondin [Patella vulgata]